MSDVPRIEVSGDFGQVYDKADPRPYYRALEPLDYRMPGVVADFLRDNAGLLRRAFATERLRVLDFACGFGAVAALVRHRLTMADLYGFYGDGSRDTAADATFIRAARDPNAAFEIAGLDVAKKALDYALACGLIDRGFDDNLLQGPPGPGLEAWMSQTAIIYESGAVLDVLLPALLALIDTAGAAKPWLLFAPRGDVDVRPIVEGLAARDYRLESVNGRPIRYRRSIGERERTLHEERIRHLGRDPDTAFEGDYIVLDLRLARPEPVARDLPVAGFRVRE